MGREDGEDGEERFLGEMLTYSTFWTDGSRSLWWSSSNAVQMNSIHWVLLCDDVQRLTSIWAANPSQIRLLPGFDPFNSFVLFVLSTSCKAIKSSKVCKLNLDAFNQRLRRMVSVYVVNFTGLEGFRLGVFQVLNIVQWTSMLPTWSFQPRFGVKVGSSNVKRKRKDPNERKLTTGC